MNIQKISEIGYFFSSNIPDLEVADATSPTGISIELGETDIFDETLYEEEDGVIWLRDVPSLINPFIDKSIKTLSIEFDKSSSTEIDEAIILPCRSTIKELIGNEAQITNFLDINFLSIAKNFSVEKDDTFKLSFYFNNLVNPEIEYTCLYKRDGQYKTFDGITTLPDEAEDDYVLVSYSHDSVQTFLDEYSDDVTWEEFVCLSLTVGKRTIRVHKARQKSSAKFRFENSFFQEELLNLGGIISKSPDLEITSAYIGTKHKNVKVEDEVSYTMKTGPLSEDEVNALTDMAKAENAWIVINGNKVPIAVSEFKLNYSNDNTEFKSAEFSFHRTENWSTDISGDMVTTKIADLTFDRSFN